VSAAFLSFFETSLESFILLQGTFFEFYRLDSARFLEILFRFASSTSSSFKASARLLSEDALDL
jgi:hypothetical protein